jgi:hypothetical protein
MDIVVASSDSKDAHKADFRCNGVADNVEIQAAIDSLSSNTLKNKFGNEKWFGEPYTYLTQRYRAIEDRTANTFKFVALDRDNEKTFSYEFAGILKDSGSVFSSVMDNLVRNVTAKTKRRYDFRDYRKFLIDEVSNIHLRVVAVNDLFPMIIIPFSALRDLKRGQPRWWRAYNVIKHSEVIQCQEGNLANAIGSLAALAILGSQMGCFIRTQLFVNVGIAYPPADPATRQERILFDMD